MAIIENLNVAEVAFVNGTNNVVLQNEPISPNSETFLNSYSNNDKCPYKIQNETFDKWESGIGIVNILNGVVTLTRFNIISSSNNNLAVDFKNEKCEVYVSPAAAIQISEGVTSGGRHIILDEFGHIDSSMISLVANAATNISNTTVVAANTSYKVQDLLTFVIEKTKENGIIGFWYNGNSTNWYPTLNYDVSSPDIITIDKTINYNGIGYSFTNSSSYPTGINTTYIYAEFYGVIKAPTTGNYTIGVNSDDGVNLYVNDIQLINNLTTTQVATADLNYSQSGTVFLNQNQVALIKIDYQQGESSGALQLLWSPPGVSSPTLIPFNLKNEQLNELVVESTANFKGNVYFDSVINLRNNSYGFNVNSNSLNYITSALSSHLFYANNTLLATISSTPSFTNPLTVPNATTNGHAINLGQASGLYLPIQTVVNSFNTRTGAITLNSNDVTTALGYNPASIDSPLFTGIPKAPTANLNSNTNQIATTAYVSASIAAVSSNTSSTYVNSFNTRTGAITLNSNDVTTALGYNPAHSGNNSDITGLTGLTTALSIAQGGTGSNTAAAALTALGAQPVGSYAALNGSSSQNFSVQNLALSGQAKWSNKTVTNPNDLSSHIDLWGGTYGFSVTSGRINYVVDVNAAHTFYANNTLLATISSTPSFTNPLTVPNATANGHAINLGQANNLYLPLQFIVNSFNNRNGAITLNSNDVTTALAYTPAHSGNNSDITGLTGLTTALSITQGGTGSNTAAGALTALGAQPIGNYANLNGSSSQNFSVQNLTGSTGTFSGAFQAPAFYAPIASAGGANNVVNNQSNMGLTVSWNYTNGGGEVDFFLGPQGGGGGLNIYQMPAGGTAQNLNNGKLLLELQGDGKLVSPGSSVSNFVAGTNNGTAAFLANMPAGYPYWLLQLGVTGGGQFHVDGAGNAYSNNKELSTQDYVNTSVADVSNSTTKPTNAVLARTLADHGVDIINVKDFGAIGDGSSHPLSSITSLNNTNTTGWTLTQWQAVYSNAAALTDEIDACALLEAYSVYPNLPIRFPAGTYLINKVCALKQATIIGDGYKNTILKFTSTGSLNPKTAASDTTALVLDIRDIQFHQTGSGIPLNIEGSLGGGFSGCSISKCLFDGLTGAPDYLLCLNDVSTSQISECFINGFSGKAHLGIISTGSGNISVNILINQCHLSSTADTFQNLGLIYIDGGSTPAGMQGCMITNCILNGCHYGIIIKNNVDYVTIYNSMVDSSYFPLYVEQSGTNPNQRLTNLTVNGFYGGLLYKPTWIASHSYGIYNAVIPTTPNGYWYSSVGTSGTSSNTEPTWPTTIGQSVVDGGVTWTCENVYTAPNGVIVLDGGGLVTIADSSLVSYNTKPGTTAYPSMVSFPNSTIPVQVCSLTNLTTQTLMPSVYDNINGVTNLTVLNCGYDVGTTAGTYPNLFQDKINLPAKTGRSNFVAGNDNGIAAFMADMPTGWSSWLLQLGSGGNILFNVDQNGVAFSNGQQLATQSYVTAATGAAQGVFNTIAALRSNTNTGLTVATLLGYSTISDGGEGIFIYNPNDTTTADNGGTIIVDGSGHRWYRVGNHAEVQVEWFGADKTGTNDSSSAIQSAINSLPVNGGIVKFGVGVFQSSTLITYTASTGTHHCSLTIQGSGADSTQIYHPSNSGFKFTANWGYQSFNFLDLNIGTNSANTSSTAIELVQNRPEANFPANTFRNVTFLDKTSTYGFGICIKTVGTCNLAIENCNFFVDASTVPNAIGIQLLGNSAAAWSYVDAIIVNISKCSFSGPNQCIVYDNLVQGVTVNQCNFTNVAHGIVVPSGATSVDQLAISLCQFSASVACILIASTSTNLNAFSVSNSTFFTNNGYGIQIAGSISQSSISCNDFTGTGNPPGQPPSTSISKAISFTNSNGQSDHVAITGNAFFYLQSAIDLTYAGYCNLSGNVYNAVTNRIINSGTQASTNIIQDNYRVLTPVVSYVAPGVNFTSNSTITLTSATLTFPDKPEGLYGVKWNTSAQFAATANNVYNSVQLQVTDGTTTYGMEATGIMAFNTTDIAPGVHASHVPGSNFHYSPGQTVTFTLQLVTGSGSPAWAINFALLEVTPHDI